MLTACDLHVWMGECAIRRTSNPEILRLADKRTAFLQADTKAGEARGAWLGEVLSALLVRAAELDPKMAAPPAPDAWAAAWGAFFPLLARHLQTLQVHDSPSNNPWVLCTTFKFCVFHAGA